MAFKPSFTITPKLSSFLNEIAVCREQILSLKILPRREIKLIKNARLRTIHSSTAIEGNPLGIREVEAVLAGKVVIGINEKDRLEVINYEKVMNFIDKEVRKQKISNWEGKILRIHRLTTEKILPTEKSGHYRIGPVFVVQQFPKKILYRAPAAPQVQKLMKDFCSWLGNKKTQELSPVIVSAIAHHQLVTIHPFADGNGRTVRALATFVLYQRGYDIKRMFALDDYYNRNRQTYYQTIQKAREEKNLNSWLEYFAEGLLIELNQVVEKARHFSQEAKIGQEPIYLSKRQREILDFIAINKKIFRSDVVDIISVSPKTAYRELEFLRKSGLVKRKGRGPSSHYV